MSLEYKIASNQWFSATITQFPTYRYLKDFVELIDADEQSSLLCSNLHGFIYGMIYRAEEQKFCSKLVHEFIMRFVDCGKNNEVWVKLNNHLARFGLQEFCLITGLPCHQISVNLSSTSNRLRNEYFDGSKKISIRMLFETFHLCQSPHDKFKLGLVMLVECVLKPISRNIDYTTLDMVDDINHFLNYPWGRIAYFVLLNSLQQSQVQRMQRLEQNHQEECKYTLHGYPLAFQYWIYEAFPQIGENFGRRRYKTPQTPRMYRWKPTKSFTEKKIKRFLASKKIQVIPFLQPDEEELQKVWYTTLSLPRDNRHNILDSIVRGEMENLSQQSDSNTEPITHAFTAVGPSSSTHCNYVTKQEIEEILNVHRQHTRQDMEEILNIQRQHSKKDMEEILNLHRQHAKQDMEEIIDVHRQQMTSDVSKYFESFKTNMIGESKSHYQAILQNQEELLEQQHKSQQDYFQQYQQSQEQNSEEITSMVRSYFNTGLTSIRSYITQENSNILNRLSECQSNIQAGLINKSDPTQKIHSSTSKIPLPKTNTEKEKKIQSGPYPLEDYDMKNYETIRHWIAMNPSGEYWKDKNNNRHQRNTLQAIIDECQEITAEVIDKELNLLRERIRHGSSQLSKEYAILDFNFENECLRQKKLEFYEARKMKGKKKSKNCLDNFPDLIFLEEYMFGRLPENGLSWIYCNYLLIPVSYPGPFWYLFLVDMREWKFQIYNCSNEVQTREQVMAYAEPSLDLVQKLLRSPNFFARQDIREHRNKEIKIDIIPDLPCANHGVNCPIFVLKYIECFILKYPIQTVDPNRMLIYRRKIATDICYSEYFLHPPKNAG